MRPHVILYLSDMPLHILERKTKGWHMSRELNVIVEQDTLEASPLNSQLDGSKPQGVGFRLAVLCLFSLSALLWS